MSPGESHKFMSQSERLKTGCTDRESRETSIPPSPRAPRPRERERMRVLSLGIMDIRGDLEDMERTKRINQQTEKSKENRDIKGTRGNSKKVEGSKEKKEHRSRGFWENKRKKRTNKKIKNSKKIRKSAKNMKTWKSPHKRKKLNPEKSDLARGDGAWESRESELQADAH